MPKLFSQVFSLLNSSAESETSVSGLLILYGKYSAYYATGYQSHPK
jgi:hypothetical protein